MELRLFIFGMLLSITLIVNNVQCQDVDEDVSLNDFEVDNRFPLNDNDDDAKESSGNGASLIDDETTAHVQFIDEPPTVEKAESDSIMCPDACTCSHEIVEDQSEIIVDCSSTGLTQLPENIDTRTTSLLLKNNQLEQVPIEISQLKSLQQLDLDDNKITDFAFGSISELPKLRSLSAAGNRLLEIPRDLKNSFELQNLELLNLSGNDIRKTIESADFEHLTNLKTLILPHVNEKEIFDICHNNNLMEIVCSVSCDVESTDCKSVEATKHEDSIDAEDESEPTETIIEEPNLSQETTTGPSSLDDVTTQNNEDVITQTNDESIKEVSESEQSVLPETNLTPTLEEAADNNENVVIEESNTSTSEGPLSRANFNEFINESLNTTETVGAAKDKVIQQGGVDNRIIAGVIVGLVVIVAAVAVKKNWTSIRNKFKPREVANHANQRGNGTTPEEMPLKDKSPV